MQHPIILLLTAALLADCGSKTNPTPTDAKIQWGKQNVAAVAFGISPSEGEFICL